MLMTSTRNSRRRLRLLLPLLTLFFIPHGQCQGEESISLNYKLYEESPDGTYVGNLAKDAKVTNKVNQFDILKLTDNDYHSYFKLQNDSSGVLRTARVIDRDRLDECVQVERCVLTVSVGVLMNRSDYVVLTVNVDLLDLNDNSPRFTPDTKVITIKENARPGLYFNLPAAEDIDGPKYGVTRYELTTNTPPQFSLQTDKSANNIPTNPRLVLEQPLDREKRASYELAVKAADTGLPAREGILKIQVIVSDVNDHRPTFTRPTYTVHVREDKRLGSLLTTVHANDKDSGRNGEIIYGFSDSTIAKHGRQFSINNSSGQILLIAPMDYEKTRSYSLGVTARDNTPDSYPVDALVEVIVEDVNDQAPQVFVNALGAGARVQVPEGVAPNHMVCHLSVQDLDSGAAGKFTCSMTHDKFKLERLGTVGQFKVTTKVMLDREATAKYELQVVCADQSPVQVLSSTTTINVYVTDSNDWPPEFKPSGPFTFRLRENKPAGSFLGNVHAEDKDEGVNAALSYRILEPVANSLLSVERNSGNITTRRRLDREEVERINFTVEARDQSGAPRSATASVQLIIIDENDEPPRFSQAAYEFTVRENQPLGTDVGQLSAADKDSPRFNSFHFSSVGSEAQSAFVIEPNSGKIFTRLELDREKVSQYRFIARATGSKAPVMSSEVTVTVRIDDDNDNAPVLIFPNDVNNTVQIPNLMQVGGQIATILARDADEGLNAKLSYFVLSGNRDGLFSVDQSTGQISLRREVRRYSLQRFSLAIRVQDGGDPARSVDTTVNILVNASLVHGAGYALGGTSNSVIVATVVVVTIVVIGVLLVAIVLVRRQELMSRQIKAKATTSSSSAANNSGYRPTKLTDSSKENPLNVNDLLVNLPASPRRHENSSHDSSLDSAVAGKQEVDFTHNQLLIEDVWATAPTYQHHNNGYSHEQHLRPPDVVKVRF